MVALSLDTMVSPKKTPKTYHEEFLISPQYIFLSVKISSRADIMENTKGDARRKATISIQVARSNALRSVKTVLEHGN